MLISPRLVQHHPITLFLFLTSLPFSYSKVLYQGGPGDPVDPDPVGPEDPVDPDPSGPDPVGPDPPYLVDIKLLNKVLGTTTCHTYQMSHPYQKYETAQVGNTYMNWGMHALQWKGYNHIADNPGGAGTFDADLANSWGPPGEDSGANGTPPSPNHVSCHGAELLDQLEEASSGIFNTDGNPTDPTGSWNCVEEPDPFSAVVLGAMNMFYWNTPTYVDFSSLKTSTVVDGYSYFCNYASRCSIEAVVMKEISLCAEGPEPPHVACNWEDNAGAEVGSCEATLVLNSIIVGYFHGPEGPAPNNPATLFYEDQWIFAGPDSVLRWMSAYGNWAGDTAELVFDPPAGTDVAALQERAHLTASKVLDPSTLARMIERANSDTKGGTVRGAAPGGKK